MARAGVAGNVLKKDTVEYRPLEVTLFYAMLRPLLEQGSQIRVEYKPKHWRKRHFVETDLSRIEAFCKFANFNKTSGFLNVRKASQKTTTFYNVVIRVEATHTEKFARGDTPEKQWAQFKITVASLNPLATTVFPPEFERSSDNMEQLRHYLQSFPIRLHREGYEVSAELKDICKSLSKQRKRKKQAAEEEEQ